MDYRSISEEQGEERAWFTSMWFIALVVIVFALGVCWYAATSGQV